MRLGGLFGSPRALPPIPAAGAAGTAFGAGAQSAAAACAAPRSSAQAKRRGACSAKSSRTPRKPRRQFLRQFAKCLALDRTERRRICFGRRAGAKRHDIGGRRHHADRGMVCDRGALWASRAAPRLPRRDRRRLMWRRVGGSLASCAFNRDRRLRFSRNAPASSPAACGGAMKPIGRSRRARAR